MLGKFSKEKSAKGFSSRTIKASAIILGDDNKYWVVTLGKMEALIKQGYTVIK